MVRIEGERAVSVCGCVVVSPATVAQSYFT